LARTRHGDVPQMRQNITSMAANNYITSLELTKILSHFGNLGDFDARKVVNAIE